MVGATIVIESIVRRVNGWFPDNLSPTWPIALARMLLGLLWLGTLRWKLPPDFDGGSQRGLREWLDLEVEHAAFSFYGVFIESVVIPNFTLFAWVVFISELLVGLGLLFGIATRAAALFGLLLSLNLLVGLLEVPGEWPWSYILMAMWHGTILVSSAGTLWTLPNLVRTTSGRRTSRPTSIEENDYASN